MSNELHIADAESVFVVDDMTYLDADDMRATLSIDMVGSCLRALVWRYLNERGVTADSAKEYAPYTADVIHWVAHGGDTPYLRAALNELVREGGLSIENQRLLDEWCNYAFNVEDLVETSRYLRDTLDSELRPPVRDGLEVEFIRTGNEPSAWRESHARSNPWLLLTGQGSTHE